MNYLVNAIKFSIKNWMLIIPIFALMALASLIGGISSAFGLFGSITSFIQTSNYSDLGVLFKLISSLFTSIAVGGGIIAFIAPFIYQPATYGLVNKSLETGNASINDIGAAISTNFVKYIKYFVGTIVALLACGILTFILLLLCVLIMKASVVIGILLFLLIALVIFTLYNALLNIWFAAMVIDEIDVVTAVKKAIEVIKGSLGTVFGITLLVIIAAIIAGAIIGFIVGWIPLIRKIIAAVVPAVKAFIMVVFSMMLYREKTGRVNTSQL